MIALYFETWSDRFWTCNHVVCWYRLWKLESIRNRDSAIVTMASSTASLPASTIRSMDVCDLSLPYNVHDFMMYTKVHESIQP